MTGFTPNFHELATAPTIDKGVVDSFTGPSDLDRTARSQGCAPDMGAFEFASTCPTTGGGTESGGGTSPPPPLPPPPPPPLAAISSLRLNPTRFRAASSGPSARSAATRPGTVVTFTMNVAASVTYRVAKVLPGRRVGARCVAPTRTNLRNRRCVRYVLIRGSFLRSAAAGPNRFRFTGRIGGRKLIPGSYHLRAAPPSERP